MIKLEPADWLKLGSVIVAAAVTYGAINARMGAVEKTVEFVPQMRIDVEVLKASMVTMSAAITALAEDERRRRDRREP